MIEIKANRWLISIIAITGLYCFFFMDEILSKRIDTADSDKTNYILAGDGIKDDTAAIQAAIDRTPSGGTLNLPAGVYKLSGNPKFKAVTGYGESFFALKITKPITIVMEEAIFKTDTDEEYGVFWIHNTSEVHLNGGFLLGDKFPEDAELFSNIAVLMQESQNSSIENMYTKNFSQGIHLHHSDHNIIRNVTAEYNYGSGIINFASNNNVIDSCVVRNSSDGHLSLYGGGESNRVVNCVVTENRPGFNIEQGITVESEKKSIIENCTVSGFYYGIDVKNGSDSIIIKSNNAFNNEYNIAVRPGDGGKNLKAPSYNIQIINNLALDPREGSANGIYVGTGEGHIVIGNTINENHLIISDGEMLEEYSGKNFFVEEGS